MISTWGGLAVGANDGTILLTGKGGARVGAGICTAVGVGIGTAVGAAIGTVIAAGIGTGVGEGDGAGSGTGDGDGEGCVVHVPLRHSSSLEQSPLIEQESPTLHGGQS